MYPVCVVKLDVDEDEDDFADCVHHFLEFTNAVINGSLAAPLQLAGGWPPAQHAFEYYEDAVTFRNTILPSLDSEFTYEPFNHQSPLRQNH